MDVYQTGWRKLPLRYAAPTHKSSHFGCPEFDQYRNPTVYDSYCTYNPESSLFASPTMHGLISHAPDHIAVSPLTAYSQYHTMVNYEQRLTPLRDVPHPKSGGENNITDCTTSNTVEVFREPQVRFDIPDTSTGTLDPRKVLHKFSLCSLMDPASQASCDALRFEQGYRSPPIDHDLTLHPSTVYKEQSALHDSDESPSPSGSFNNSASSKHVEHENASIDKPYAKLIYDALMQAPKHKMMLRDIYDWFEANTTKPQESVSPNGWQNSIRHNLSMNQAFENEKRDSCPGRSHTRKANSVWMLTEHAVKHGVQSTTRYRKQGLKKSVTHRAPAAERQRSGAKGGRATRKCGIHPKTQDDMLNDFGMPACADPLLSFQPDTMEDDGAARDTPHSDFVPPTPAPATQLDPLYILSSVGYGTETEFSSKTEDSDFAEQSTYMCDRLFDLYSDPSLDEITKMET